jgi:dTMP kinase
LKTLNNFIVFESIDGGGKSTQSKILVDHFIKKGKMCSLDTEPTHSDIGKLIRATLRGESDVIPDALAGLFAADRYQHVYAPATGIEARIDQGEIVVCDRYVLSSLAYQGSYVSDPELTRSLNVNFPLPTLLVYLDVPVDVALERISKRSGIKEMFDRRETLEKIYAQYDQQLKVYEGAKLLVYGTRDVESIADFIWDRVSDIIE